MDAFEQLAFFRHGGDVVQGQGSRYRVTLGERGIEQALAKPGTAAKTLKADSCLGEHFRIDVYGNESLDTTLVQNRFAECAGAGPEVQHKARANRGQFAARPGSILLHIPG